ncbi:MAG: HAD family phosphatase [Anaerolineales bacterium]|nr:MAG: HAD family phosphatase [Chloroflexota bacterium]MBE7433467.1 HAD family phosphatase [Anaerolineales bacterium]MCE7858682.1 HAD family phosphatase [Chloroflexi bacterium CFX2]MCK6581649.1 HAD family phosphatase [Anaerolineales bacterium]GJQ34163.1 MAG: haloacid dehalogenase [Anaerolineaceae bacterium]
MLKALIFDFDGLILDTETPEVLVWQNIYKEHGFELPVEEWQKTVGGYGISNFDPAQHLSHLSQGTLDPVSLQARYRREADAIIHSNPIMPGVMDMIHDAQANGLKVAIGSSSPHSWVDSHTQRLDIHHHFEHIICQDDVAPGRTKPHPDIFLKALEKLNVNNDEAVVFEDSPNGVLASKRAGVFVVAVPNPLTAKMNVQGDMTVSSLAELSLKDLMR